MLRRAHQVKRCQDPFSFSISVNEKKVAEGRIERTSPFLFSADETADVGVDEATPVTEAYMTNPQLVDHPSS